LATESLRKLELPDEGREDFDRYLDNQRKVLQLLRESQNAIAGNPNALARIGPRLESAGTEAENAARSYGLEDCPPAPAFVTFVRRVTS
jgi:hypothetical protein